jgi:hypothetical protein
MAEQSGSATDLRTRLSNDGCRRIPPVAVRPGEGRFSRPITANQAQRRELVFMPLSSQCRSKI